MSSEAQTQEMFVLKALEAGLECAEEVLCEVLNAPMTKLRPHRKDAAVKDVEQIKHAITLVEGWLAQ